MTTAHAPGKIILFGEHAVVYSRPAIAVPLLQLQATGEVTDLNDSPRGKVWLQASAVDLSCWLHECPKTNPLAKVVRLTLDEVRAVNPPALSIRVTSQIPIASGLGSGAAVSVAVIRALSEHLGSPLTLERQSSLAFEVEKLHHGTPSGVDNTVITFSQPVYFVRGTPPESFKIGRRFELAIGVSDMPAPTAVAVSTVRQGWLTDPERYDDLFDAIGHISEQARHVIQSGQPEALGPLMDENQDLLEELGVSSSALRELILAARAAGALGAKLSGAGLGGNVIALVTPETRERVLRAYESAGAIMTMHTEVRN